MYKTIATILGVIAGAAGAALVYDDLIRKYTESWNERVHQYVVEAAIKDLKISGE